MKNKKLWKSSRLISSILLVFYLSLSLSIYIYIYMRSNYSPQHPYPITIPIYVFPDGERLFWSGSHHIRCGWNSENSAKYLVLRTKNGFNCQNKCPSLSTSTLFYGVYGRNPLSKIRCSKERKNLFSDKILRDLRFSRRWILKSRFSRLWRHISLW